MQIKNIKYAEATHNVQTNTFHLRYLYKPFE
jgi:hypothetical protein